MVEKLKQTIIEKATNNKDKQAYIRPSDFSFGLNIEDTKKCLELILQFDFVQKASMLGKDLIDVILK